MGGTQTSEQVKNLTLAPQTRHPARISAAEGEVFACSIRNVFASCQYARTANARTSLPARPTPVR